MPTPVVRVLPRVFCTSRDQPACSTPPSIPTPSHGSSMAYSVSHKAERAGEDSVKVAKVRPAAFWGAGAEEGQEMWRSASGKAGVGMWATQTDCAAVDQDAAGGGHGGRGMHRAGAGRYRRHRLKPCVHLGKCLRPWGWGHSQSNTRPIEPPSCHMHLHAMRARTAHTAQDKSRRVRNRLATDKELRDKVSGAAGVHGIEDMCSLAARNGSFTTVHALPPRPPPSFSPQVVLGAVSAVAAAAVAVGSWFIYKKRGGWSAVGGSDGRVQRRGGNARVAELGCPQEDRASAVWG